MTGVQTCALPICFPVTISFGKVELSFKKLGVTAATISAHKIGGPLGVAALILKKGLDIEPVLHGGGQERDLRSGTFNAPGIIAFAAAARNAMDNRVERELKIRELKKELIQTIKKMSQMPGLMVIKKSVCLE